MSTKRTIDHFFQVPSKKARTEQQINDHAARSSFQSESSPATSPSTSKTSPATSFQSAPLPSPITVTTSSATSFSFDPSFLTPTAEPASVHATYPFAIPRLPDALLSTLELGTPADPGSEMTEKDAPNLDVISYTPFLERGAAAALFRFLRASLPFYRVNYSIRRGGTETEIRTPRFTTVFGVDETAEFTSSSSSASSTAPVLVSRETRRPLPPSTYPTCRPRPVPDCLAVLLRLVEAMTGQSYNFVLVNYYASPTDSISWHSDDESFLGVDPTIASLSLGGTRDFMLRHKALARDVQGRGGLSGNRGVYGGGAARGGSARGGGGGGAHPSKGSVPTEPTDPADPASEEPRDAEGLTAHDRRVRAAHKTPLKFAMAGGDMVLMRGRTQRHWLHSVPKRAASSAGGGGGGGRINITFRRVLAKPGTGNYYQYNVGRGPAVVWDDARREMVEWVGPGAGKGAEIGTKREEEEEEEEEEVEVKEKMDGEGVGDAARDGNESLEDQSGNGNGGPKDTDPGGIVFERDGTARDVNGAAGWTRQSSKYGLKFERTFHGR